MKGFQREDQLFSLCGLNCGLCSMHLGGYCPGCGGGEGNQSCAIARCALQHDAVSYCNQCHAYPCEKYDKDPYDTFISKRNQHKDFQRMARIGINAYRNEQKRKVEVLQELLDQYNDGRKKTFYCVAVNLLELDVIEGIMKELRETAAVYSDIKERAACASALFQSAGKAHQIELKLRKKPKQNV